MSQLPCQLRWAGRVDELQKNFSAAGSIEAMRKVLAIMKDARAEQSKAVSPLRKAVSLLRALVKRKEAGQLKGAQLGGESASGEPGAAGTLASVVQHFANHVCNEKGKAGNCVDLKQGFHRLRPTFVEADPLETLVTDVQYLPVLIKWLDQQLGTKETVSVVLDKPKHYDPIFKVITTALHKSVIEKPYSVLHDSLQGIFALSLHRATAKNLVPGFMPFGLGSWFVPVEGSLLVVAALAEKVPGHSFSTKLENMARTGPEDMAKLAHECGFWCKCAPGTAAWAPPGYLTLVAPLGSCVYLKWSSMAPQPHTEGELLRKVLSSATLMLSSFPTLGPTYKEWLRYLEVQSTPQVPAAAPA